MLTMKNRKIVLIAGLSILIFSTSIYATENLKLPRNQSLNKIQKYMSAKNNKSFANIIVATIDGQPVKQTEVEEFKALRDDNLSYEECLNKVIENRVLFKEAEKEKLIPTDKEVKKSVECAKGFLENKATQEDRDVFNALIKGLGMSSEEYWNSIGIKAYREVIAISNIKSKLLKEAATNLSENSIKAKERQDKLNQKLNELLSNLKSRHNVKILYKQKLK
jgi:hypothetical protein